ncbi:unnamed protein product [Lota lota]
MFRGFRWVKAFAASHSRSSCDTPERRRVGVIRGGGIHIRPQAATGGSQDWPTSRVIHGAPGFCQKPREGVEREVKSNAAVSSTSEMFERPLKRSVFALPKVARADMAGS